MDYERKSEWNAALAAYEKVLRHDWHHLPAYAQLAALFLQQKQLARALKVCRRGLRVAPKNFYLMMNMAATYFMRGVYSQAKRICEECQRQRPEDEFVAKQLATAANALELQRGRNRYCQSSLQPQQAHVAQDNPGSFATPESETK
jgi:tetratricopeptide (TPR) repeat protein